MNATGLQQGFGTGRRAMLAAALLTGWTLTASAQKPAPPAKVPEPPKPTLVKPGSFAEQCVALGAPQKLEYQFQSSKPLNFNIHYHKGTQVLYPVRNDKVTSGEDRFAPTTGREEYCLMWENKSPSAEVELTYTYKIVK